MLTIAEWLTLIALAGAVVWQIWWMFILDLQIQRWNAKDELDD